MKREYPHKVNLYLILCYELSFYQPIRLPTLKCFSHTYAQVLYDKLIYPIMLSHNFHFSKLFSFGTLIKNR